MQRRPSLHRYLVELYDDLMDDLSEACIFIIYLHVSSLGHRAMRDLSGRCGV